MRVSAWTLSAILAAGAFLAMGAESPATALADTRSAAAADPISAQVGRSEAPRAPSATPLPASRAEESSYAQREASAPAAVKGYSGGFIIFVLVAILLVVLIVHLVNRT